MKVQSIDTPKVSAQANPFLEKSLSGGYAGLRLSLHALSYKPNTP